MSKSDSSTYDLLCRLIGQEATIALMREVGGTEIVLVRGETRTTAAKRAHLAEIVGDEKYEIMLRHFGVYSRLSVPMGKAMIRAWEISEAIRLIGEGLTDNEVAIRLKHSYRWVQRVTKTNPEAQEVKAGKAVVQGPQAELF